jgi:DNA repair protein RadC
VDTETLYYKPTKFKQNEKGIENYQTGKKENIAYKNLFYPSLFNAQLDNKTGSHQIWEKGSSNRSLAPKLAEGEFAIVERKYSEIGMFDFTTRDNNKINSDADVAFIFRQLESESVEHAFAVYIDKDKKPSVQWLSMGGVNATIIDPRIMVDAAQKLKATQIYLVHNHPSGSLKPSRADMNIFGKLKRGFEPMDISVNAIIINLNSGKYLIFDENGYTVAREGFTAYDFKREEKVGVFSFNKQAFLQSPINTKINSPSDVAQFLSQQKFSSGEKAGYLLLSQKNEIVGNFFATQNTRNHAYKEVAALVSKFGAVNVIAYTNKADNAEFYRNLKADLSNLEINLLDVIECESSAFVSQTFDKYKSLVQQTRLYEKPLDYDITQSKISETKFNLATGGQTQYDIAFGHKGNGITVWNRQQFENNDYKTIAHISDSGQVNLYDNNLPEDVKKQIRNIAEIQEAKFDQQQYDEMRFDEERESQPYEKPEEFDYSFPSKLVTVIPLTQEQRNDMCQNPYYVPPNYGFPDLNLAQIASIPDVIEGHTLDYQDKLVLYESELQFEGENASYRIAENNTIVKEQNEMKPKVLTHADVVFNNFEVTKQNFEDVQRRNQRPPADFYQDDRVIVNEIQTNYITNKSRIMNRQNTVIEANLTNQEELNNNEENFSQKNLDYINNQIKYLGFGEGLNKSLKEAMDSGKEKIDFPISKEFFSPNKPEQKQEVGFTLHFAKGKESNMYFLNSYSAQLKGLSSEMNNEQKFYINRGKGFTSKEAFNLLSGRTVNKDLTNKEGETYNAWVKLKPSEENARNRDFQIFNENYGFDLKETLSKYPIKEMETPEAAERLLNSLKKGNTQSVTFIQNGEESSKFISANPQFKNLSIHNQDGSVMFQNNIGLNKNQNAQTETAKEQSDKSSVLKVVKSPGMKR